MKKFYIDYDEVSEDEFYEELENEVRSYIESSYDDVLDDMYPPYEIGCCTFYASSVLKQLDPIAYNCGIDDFVDSELNNAHYDLEKYGVFQTNGTRFEIVEEDEEDE